jgi:hypothetical protein
MKEEFLLKYRRRFFAQKSLDGELKSKDVNGDVEELMKEMSRKLNEIRANQERIECNIKASLKNLKGEIIDEIRGSVSTKRIFV